MEKTDAGTTTPPKARTVRAFLAAAVLFGLSAAVGPTGIGAIIGVLCVLPWVTRMRRDINGTLLAVALAGGMIGAVIQGTEEVPPSASFVRNLLRMFEVTGVRAFLWGVLGAGVGAVLIAAWLRRGNSAGAVPPRELVQGQNVLALALPYTLITLIAIPQFSGVRSHSARRMMESDLRNLILAQQTYFDANHHFALTIRSIKAYTTSPGVTVTIDDVDGSSWSASATQTAVTTTCTIVARVATDATLQDNRPTCTEHRRWF